MERFPVWNAVRFLKKQNYHHTSPSARAGSQTWNLQSYEKGKGILFNHHFFRVNALLRGVNEPPFGEKTDTNDQQLNLILRPTLRIKFQGFTNASSSWKYRRKKQQRQQIVRVHPWCRTLRVNSHQLERFLKSWKTCGAPWYLLKNIYKIYIYIQNITLTITLPVFWPSLSRPFLCWKKI